jgi:hypothetical protein
MIIEKICVMSNANKMVKDRQQFDLVFEKLKGDIISGVRQELKETNENLLQRTIDDLKKILETNSSSLSTSMYNLIDTRITNSFQGMKEDLRGSSHQDILVTMIQNLQSSQTELNRELSKEIKGTSQGEEVLKVMIESLQTDIKTLSINKRSSSYKGQEGEQLMIELLETKLTSRNGYEVVDCHSQPHNLDILIKKSGYNDVRIDVKNHGRDSKEDGRIRTNEVKRFESDVLNCSCHGILVSLHSKICGKEEIQFDRLSNGKCVVYLSNNQYNVDFIVEMLQILQFIDDRCRSEKQSNEEDRLSLSSDAVQKINEIIIESEQKIYDLKTKLEQSVKLVSSIKFDLINSLFRGHQMKTIPESETIRCEYCDKIIKVCKGSYKKHLKHCPVFNKNQC